MSEAQSQNMGDYNRGGYMAFMFCMAVTMIFFVYIAFIHPGVDLKELEVQAAQKEAAAGAPQGGDAAAAAAPQQEEQKKEADVGASQAAPQAEPQKAH